MSVTELLSGSGTRDVNDGHPASCECVDCDWGDEGVDDRGDVERLLDILRQPDPPPARVKVKPLGHTEFSQGITRIFLRCAVGFSATCTEHGELNTYGAKHADVVGDIIAREHLRKEHR